MSQVTLDQPGGARTRAQGSGAAKRGARRGRRIGLAGSAAALLASGAGMLGTSAAASASSSAPSGSINLVAYSTPEPAYQQLVKDFKATPAGANVTVNASYGPSGQQSRNVAAGQPADVVNFSLASDLDRLVKAKIVAPTWNADPVTHGMVTNSLVVFVVPKGNPQHIQTWADLLKSGIKIYTPNPYSSGSARWNLVAAYGAQLKLGKTAAQATSYLKALLSRTAVQSASAADELTAFTQANDPHAVLLDYEDDAIQAKRAGEQIDYVIPKQTILIQNPLAVTNTSKNAAAAQAFAKYLLSPAGQTQWAYLGYRPTRPTIAAKFRKKFPVPTQLFTIQYVGGWDQVANTFFSTSTSSPGIVTKIESSLGQSTSSS
ncbi:MAG: sulfate transporter, periplasmic sulfate-binding protein [Acidimicrobiaceae bacterium]|nr:sulfate transporter, periplasmic sulfate-binding protein [Acidimicrobiaceae bacterium]